MTHIDSLTSSFLPSITPPQPHHYRPSPRLSNPIIRFAVVQERGVATEKPRSRNPDPKTSATTTKRGSEKPSNTSLGVNRPTQTRSLGDTILNVLDDVVNTFVDPPRRAYIDPRHVLCDNFAPVANELEPTECQVVEGSIPSSLYGGAYIRNGPNPQFLPRGPYHLFDGDGMVHVLKISPNGRSTLCSRYIQTYKYKVEKEAGGPLIPNVFSGFNGATASAARGAVTTLRLLAGQFNPLANGIGLANTNLAIIGNRLFALGESDLPYAVQVTENGDLLTLGRDDFDGKLVMSMTAHPKIDPDTREAFAFRYGPIPPFLTFFRFDRDGNKQPDVPIFSMTSPSFLHDFAITKTYAIFAEIQLGMRIDPWEMLVNGGSPVGANMSKTSRIGVIPRYAKDESNMKWFDVPGFNPIHTINAWEEDAGQKIVVIAPNILSVQHTLERMDLIHATIEKVTIDLKTGTITRRPLATRNLDFAMINASYIAKKNKYIYAAVGEPMPKVTGVVKLDLSKGETCPSSEVACRIFKKGCVGGEPYFVPRKPEDPMADEDDGYVVMFVHDEITGESQFLVMDAKSPVLETVAAVRLPTRVPCGFHGLFVSQSELGKL